MKLYSGIFLPLLLWFNSQRTEAFDLSGPGAHKVLMGSKAILRCSFTMDRLPLDTKFLAIHWFFMGNQILAYDNTLNVSRPELSMDLQAALMGDASLIISNVKISDKGEYKCWVVYSPESSVKAITLDVQARPVVRITTKPVIKDEENMLHCTISGFYPSDISITWLLGGKFIQSYETYKPQRQDDGTYNVSSTAAIIPADDNQNKTYTCRVTHVSLRYPLKETFQLTVRERAVSRFSEGSADQSDSSFRGLFIAIPVILLMVVVLLTWWIFKTRGVRCAGNEEVFESP
ncbi:natural cytotoxicity triggering receptor 3 ligand 1-like, partial [Anomaloglossus baeobatrachus]